MAKQKKFKKQPYRPVDADAAIKVRILHMNGASPEYVKNSTGVDYKMQDRLTSLNVMPGKEFLPAGYKHFLAARGISHTV